MSLCFHRRRFVKTGLAAGALLTFPGLTRITWANPAPSDRKLASVRAKEAGKIQDPAALTELATQLTERAIQEMGGMGRFVSKGDVVWIKPNMSWDKKPEYAANTNPDVVAAVIRLAYEAGAAKVKVSDNSCNEARSAYDSSNIKAVASKAGAEVLFHDERKYKEMEIGGKNIKKWVMYTEIVEADKLISCPVAKDHRLSGLTVGMKNLMGVMGGKRNQTHQDLGQTIADLANFLRPQLTVVDAVRIMTKGGPVGGGNLDNVERRDTVIAASDIVAADAFAASLFPRDLKTVLGPKEAEAMGVGTTDFASVGAEPVILG